MKRLPISEPVKTAFFTVLFIFLFLYLFSRLLGPIPFSVNSVTTNKTDLFTVSGEGEVAAVPDTAQVMLGVTASSPTVEAAKTQVNTKTNDIIASLKELGIEERFIKTTNYSINPNYDYSSGDTGTITGYNVSQNLEVEVKPIETANKAVEVATEKGANMIGGITFVLNDEDREALEKEARKEAIEKAKTKAADIASAAGIKLGRIVSVSESGMPQPVMFDLQRSSENAMGSAGDQVDLQPGESSVRITVSLSYETF